MNTPWLILLVVGGCHVVSGLEDFEVAQGVADGGAGHGGAAGAPMNGGGGAGGVGTGGSPEGGAGGSAPPIGCAAVGGESGVYSIDPDGDGGNVPFDAYCEQTVAGGGWTLVGRSVAAGIGMMGWRVSQGMPSQGFYSLDVVAAGLVFTEVLVMALDGDRQAFRIVVPSGFVTDHATTALNVDGSIYYVQGGCDPADNSQPTMLRYIGHTDQTNRFFLRDNDSALGSWGLNPDGFALEYQLCASGGGLDGRLGEIYVR